MIMSVKGKKGHTTRVCHRGMSWPKKGATPYHAKLRLLCKGRAIKELVEKWVLLNPRYLDRAALSYPGLLDLMWNFCYIGFCTQPPSLTRMPAARLRRLSTDSRRNNKILLQKFQRYLFHSCFQAVASLLICFFYLRIPNGFIRLHQIFLSSN